MEETTLVAALRATARKHPDRVAVRTKDDAVSLTYGELLARVDALAGGLAGLGVRRGDAVALMLANRPEFHVADLAAATLGATPFSIYATSSAEQVAYVVADAGARVVITERLFMPQIEAARAQMPAVEHVLVLEDGWPEDRSFDVASRVVEPDDLVTLIYTSGTTGPPKGVELRHRNVVAAVADRRHADRLPGRLARDLLAPGGPHRRADGAPLPAGDLRHDDHDVLEPARRRRLPARRAADLVLRGPARLREAQGRDGGLPRLRRGRAAQPRVARRGHAQGRVRAGRRAGAGRPRGDGGAGGRGAVRRRADDARLRRAAVRERGRGADAARGARLLPRDRRAAGRAVGHVRDLRGRALQPAGGDPDRDRRPARGRASRSSSPTTASCWCARRS